MFNYHGLRILIADDSYDIVHLFQITLENIGAKVEVVANGKDALQLFRDHDFDLILLDYNMPGISGVEAGCRMREEKPDIPIAILTGLLDAKEECPFPVWNKPLDIATLNKNIGSILGPALLKTDMRG